MQSTAGLLSRGEGTGIRRLRFLEDARQSSGEKGTMQEKKLTDLCGESSLLYILRHVHRIQSYKAGQRMTGLL